MNARPIVLLLGASAWLAASLAAQCPSPPTWQSSDVAAAPLGPVYAMTFWDPDGAGPLGQHLVCGGTFQVAGNALAANIAMLDPVARTWSALGAGFDGAVQALTVLADGSLLAAGWFVHSGATAVSGVARWDGSAWLPLGGGLLGGANAAAVLPNGDLVVGGQFSTAGGVPAANIARWDGSAWSTLGSGLTGIPSYAPPMPMPWPLPFGPAVTHLGVRSNGDLIVAGLFADAGGIPAVGLARWNGTWSSLTGTSPVRCTALQVLANDDVVIGVDAFGGNYQAQRWNGSQWATLGGSDFFAWTAFAEEANGTLVGQAADPSNFTFPELREWNGVAWSVRPSSGRPLAGPASALLASGANELWIADSQTLGGRDQSVRRFDGTSWRAPAPGLDGRVEAATTFQGDLALAGSFGQIGNVPCDGVAVRQNGVWSPLGSIHLGSALALQETSLGLVVGGYLQLSAGSPFVPSARWSGTQWQPMPSAYPFDVIRGLAEAANGELFACGSFGDYAAIPSPAVRWNGTSWVPLGIGSYYAAAIAVLPTGDPVLGVGYTGAQLVLRWDGSAWVPLGSGLVTSSVWDSILRLLVLPNGDLVAAGGFHAGPGLANVARWDGVAWQSMGGGFPEVVRDLALLPNGELVASHMSYGPTGEVELVVSRWNGSTWTPMPSIGAAYGTNAGVLAVTDPGELLLAGAFDRVGGQPSAGLAILSAGCPVARQVVAQGCSGSTGSYTLEVTASAWLGGTYRAHVGGLPAQAGALHLLGVASNPRQLSSLVPQGVPGCVVFVDPQVEVLDMAATGSSGLRVPVPVATTLLGQSFLHQALPFDLTQGFVTDVGASTTVASTIGAW